MKNIDLYTNIYSSNLNSLLIIYNDSENIRKSKETELESQIEKWEESDFEDFYFYRYHFDWILIESLFISGFSHFENFLRVTAEQVEKEINPRIRIKDLKVNGEIDVYRKFLFLIAEIKAANSDFKEWQNILLFIIVGK